MSARTLGLAILLVTLTATVILCVGFAPPHWLQKDFVLTMKGEKAMELDPRIDMGFKNKTLPAIVVLIFKNSKQHINVSSNMGLFKSCKDKSLQVFTERMSSSGCDKKGAKDWQKIAFGLAVVALVFALVDIIMSLLAVVVKRLQENMRFRFGIVVCNFVTAGFAVSPVLLYVFNKRIKVNAKLPDIIDYDLDWGLYVTAVSACFFSLLVLLNALYLVCFSFGGTNRVEEPTAMYSKNFNN